jgi:RNA polymerase sigma-70 factor (ECF subfamily)
MPTTMAAAERLDDEEVRALYDEHAGAVLGYALRLTGDRQRAEDVVQETMLRAWRHPEASTPSRGSLRPWLLIVARNIVIDNARARRSRPAEVGAACLPWAAAPDDLEAVLVAQDIAGALATLSQSHRAVVVETYFRGQCVAEAAVTLGIPVGTVKSRTYYALRALRLALEERDSERA